MFGSYLQHIQQYSYSILRSVFVTYCMFVFNINLCVFDSLSVIRHEREPGCFGAPLTSIEKMNTTEVNGAP